MRARINKLICVFVAAASLLVFAPLATAEIETYQTRTEFLRESLGTDQPKSGVVWIGEELRAAATDILGHPPDMLRIRFWYKGPRTAWIINEIGKEKPITLGVVVEDDEIHSLRVLQFRESRGWEIRHPFFTNQFSGVRLNQKGSLNQRLDGITGATLSVRAATRSANLALVLDEYAKRRSQTGAAAP